MHQFSIFTCLALHYHTPCSICFCLVGSTSASFTHTHKKVMLCHLHLCFLDLICICGQMHFIAESLFNYPNIIIICKVWSAFTIGLQWFAYQLYIDINKFICPATSPQTTGLLNMSAHKQKCSYASSWNSLWNYPSQLLVTRLTAEMP